MTKDEKLKVLNDYCESNNGDCSQCKIDDICSEIYGDFDHCENALDEVCNIISNLTNDVVNHPYHYTQGGIECIDAMTSAFGKDTVKGFCICNAFKYIFRHQHKNGIEDLDKAIWYINKYKELSNEPTEPTEPTK